MNKEPSMFVDENGNPLVAEPQACSEGGCCDCEDCPSVQDEDAIDGEVDLDEENRRMMEARFIKHPFSESFSPMALVEVGEKTYICGVAEVDPDSLSCVAVNPMLFMEHITEGGGLSIAMRLPHLSLGCIDSIQLNYNSLYFFQNSRSQDMRITASYESNYRSVKMSESGIVAPTAEEMMKIQRG